MTERDGREGHRCRDCGCYLQWWTFNGSQYLRCPWVSELTLSTAQVAQGENGDVTRVYCGRPYRGKQEGGVPIALPRSSW